MIDNSNVSPENYLDDKIPDIIDSIPTNSATLELSSVESFDVSGAPLQTQNHINKSSLLRLFVVCYLSYFIAVILAMVTAFFGGVLAFGSSSNLVAPISGVMVALVLSIIPLSIQTSLFRHNTFRKSPGIYKESIYIIGILFVAFYIGNAATESVSGKYGSTTSVLIAYLINFFSLVICALLNSFMELRAAKRIGSSYKYPNNLLVGIGFVAIVLSLITVTGSVYQYGYIEEVERKAYTAREAGEETEKLSIQQAAINDFKNNKEDWYIIPTSDLTDSESPFTLEERYYEPARNYGENGMQYATLRSTYTDSSGILKKFYVYEALDGNLSKVPLLCIATLKSCEISRTEIGQSQCYIENDLNRCSIFTNKGTTILFGVLSKSQIVDPTEVINIFELQNSSNIVLTR